MGADIERINMLIAQLRKFYKDLSIGKYGLCINPQNPDNPDCFPILGGYVGIADEAQRISRLEPTQDWIEAILSKIQYLVNSAIGSGPLLFWCAEILSRIRNEGNTRIWETPSDRTNNYGIYLTSMMFINPFLSVKGPLKEDGDPANAATKKELPECMKNAALLRIETPIPAGAPAFVQPPIEGLADHPYAFPLVYVDYAHHGRFGEDSACLLLNPRHLVSLPPEEKEALGLVDLTVYPTSFPISEVYDYEDIHYDDLEYTTDWPWACNTFVGESLFFTLLIWATSSTAQLSYEDDDFRQNLYLKDEYLQKCFRIHRQMCKYGLISDKNRYESTVRLYEALCKLVGRSSDRAPFIGSFTNQQYLEELRKDFGLCSGSNQSPSPFAAYIMILGCDKKGNLPHHVEIVTNVEVLDLSPSVLKRRSMTSLIRCTSIGAHPAGAYEHEYLICASRSRAKIQWRTPNSTDPSFGTYAYSHARFFKIDSSILDKLLGRA